MEDQSNTHFTNIARQLNLSVMGDLQKSHITEAFLYSSSDKIKITKTGKEIKQALSPQVEKYSSKAATELAKMTALKAQIPENIVPTEPVPDYWSNGYEEAFSEFKRYSWESCRNSIVEAPSLDNSMMIEEEKSDYDKVEKSFCNQYNDTLRKYVEYCVESKVIQTLINGLKDSKEYELSVKQAATLGF